MPDNMREKHLFPACYFHNEIVEMWNDFVKGYKFAKRLAFEWGVLLTVIMKVAIIHCNTLIKCATHTYVCYFSEYITEWSPVIC